MSHSSVWLRPLVLVRLTPIIGKAEKVMRQTVVVAVVGRVARICDNRLWTCSSEVCMSTDQLKNTFTSADPRLVAERTLVTPGMSFIASSMGRVIVAIIWSAGITPLSIVTATRGKFVCGKIDEGMDQPASTPARQTQIVTNTIALD